MNPVRQAAVYVREHVPAETRARQELVLARIESLREQGIIGDFSVTYWNRYAVVGDSEFSELVTAFEEWAAETGVTLAPAFDRHDRSNWFTGVNDSVVTLPVICLGIYEDNQLVSVYPHIGPAGQQTVADGLDRLESTPQLTDSNPRRSSPTRIHAAAHRLEIRT